MLFGLVRRRRRVHVDIASMSERGLVRPDNQDHVLVNRRGLVFCVADGMGGGQGGAEASGTVCRCLAEALRRRADFGARVRCVDAAVRRADREIREQAAKAGYSQMGSTATLLVVDGEGGRRAVVGNVGDSRIYRLREGVLSQLTHDHTLSDELRRHAVPGAGRSLLDLRAAAFSHVLTRVVGAGRDVRVDWCKIDIREGDVFLVCSDGLHGMIPDELIGDVLARGASRDALSRLRALVLARGAPDNFSAIVVRIGSRA